MSRAPEPLRPVYGIWGEDQATVDRAVERLVARVAAEGGLPPERFAAAATPGAEVVAACTALSLAGTRLVVVREADAWRAADVAALADYLAEPTPGTCLALVAERPPAPKLVDAVADAGQVLHYGPDPKARRSDRSKWFADHLRKEAKRLGTTIPLAVAREVVVRTGDDAGALAQEAAKLAAYAGPEPVTREMVRDLVAANPEAQAFRLGDAIVAGNAAKAQGLLADLAAGDQRAAPIVIQSTLARHLRGVAAAQALGAEAGVAAVEAATGLRGFPAQKAVEHARALPPGAGERCVVRLAALELDLRVSALSQLGASRDDGERLVLEVAVRDLVAVARR